MVVMVYITCPDEVVAEHISQGLLEAHLIACANIFPVIISMYHWEGKIQKSSEIAVWCKTTQQKVDVVKDWVLKHHPYSCPCILVLPITDGNPQFIDWIKKEVQKD